MKKSLHLLLTVSLSLIVSAQGPSHLAAMEAFNKFATELLDDDLKKPITQPTQTNRLLHGSIEDSLIKLLDDGLKEQAPKKNPNEQLWQAASIGDISGVSAALRAGAGINIRTEMDATALNIAAHFGHTAVVNALIVFGAQINHQDIFGLTALHLAAHAGHVDTINALLGAGADGTITNKMGYTPADIARQRGYTNLEIMFNYFTTETRMLPRFSPIKRIPQIPFWNPTC